MGKAKKVKHAADVEHELVGKAAKLRTRAPVAVLGKASEIADQPPLVALSLATIAAGVLLQRRAIARTGARMLVAHALATGGKSVLKRSIDRTRPAKALTDGEHRTGTGKGGGDTDFNSFPSGHTAGAVSIAQAVANTAPRFGTPVRVAAAGVAAMQLPRGKHYPSDIAVGAVIGWAADWVAGTMIDTGERTIDRLVDRYDQRKAEAEAEAHPS